MRTCVWSFIVVAMGCFKEGASDCTDPRESCHFCAVNASQPRYFRYTDQYMNRIPACLSFPENCEYDCEQIYHVGSGSVMDFKSCLCTAPDPNYKPPNERGCKLFDLEPETIPSGRVGRIYVETPLGIDIRGDQMCFNATQHINIPYFSKNDLGFKVNLKLRFRPTIAFSEMPDGKEMILWTDGHCGNVKDDQPAFEVKINRTGVIVQATGLDNVQKTLYCQPHVTDSERKNGANNFLAPPLMNKIMVLYRAGDKFDSNGKRHAGMLVVTVNDGVFKSKLSGTCFGLSLGPPELKASMCPLRIPGESFRGCLSKVSLKRDCKRQSKEEKDLLNFS